MAPIDAHRKSEGRLGLGSDFKRGRSSTTRNAANFRQKHSARVDGSWGQEGNKTPDVACAACPEEKVFPLGLVRSLAE